MLEQTKQDFLNQKSDSVFKEGQSTKEEKTPLFAEGLPDWDIVPPQVVVIRRRKQK